MNTDIWHIKLHSNINRSMKHTCNVHTLMTTQNIKGMISTLNLRNVNEDGRNILRMLMRMMILWLLHFRF